MARSHELLAGFEGTDEGQPNQTQPNFWEQVTKAAEARAKELSNCSVTRCWLYDRLAAIMALPQPEYDGQAKQFKRRDPEIHKPFCLPDFPLPSRKARQKEFAILVELAIGASGGGIQVAWRTRIAERD